MTKAAKKAIILIMSVILIMVISPLTASAAGKTPGKVTGLKTTVKKQTVTVKWNKAKNAKKYQIQVQVKKGKKWNLFRTLNTKKCTVKFNGSVNGVYRTRVRAVSKKAGKWSAWKGVKVNKVTKATNTGKSQQPAT